jgi:hypothetical protein
MVTHRRVCYFQPGLTSWALLLSAKTPVSQQARTQYQQYQQHLAVGTQRRDTLKEGSIGERAFADSFMAF